MLPENVQSAIQSFCHALDARMPGAVGSVYLYGSIALDAYIEGSSDIDFLVIANRPLTDEDARSIAGVHDDMARRAPGLEWMGAYIQTEDLGKSVGEIPLIITCCNQSVRTDGTGADINPVTWWLLKRRGEHVFGKKLDFAYDIHEDALVRYVRNNMNTYWVQWIDRLEAQDRRFTPQQLDEAVEWCVLGMLRQWFTIREKDVTSKTGAGFYGLQHLPARWHGLIREAISIKEGTPPATRHSASESRRNDLVALLRMIHAKCNGIA